MIGDGPPLHGGQVPAAEAETHAGIGRLWEELLLRAKVTNARLGPVKQRRVDRTG